MNKLANTLKPLMPILAVIYATALIYLTALPLDGDGQPLCRESVSWLLTLGAIGLTLYLVQRVMPKLYPSASQFSLRPPSLPVALGVMLIAPLWLVAESHIVYGLTSLFHAVRTESLTYTAEELREDLLASFHAVLLAPVLEELCFRHLAISPFRRRRAQVVVCILVAVLFGIFHVRNFPGAFLGAMFYGLAFIWTRNIWFAILIHAGRNLMVTLFALYVCLGLGSVQTARIPVIFLPDTKLIILSVVLAIAGIVLIKNKKALSREIFHPKE